MRAFLSSSLSLLVTATAVAAQNSTGPVSCSDGLYIVVVRGTNEDPGPGASGVVADAIAERIPGSVVAPLDYPAGLTEPAYGVSVETGVGALRELLSTYYSDCPDGKTAVIGYSQGAQVTTYSFCAGTSADLLGNELSLGETLEAGIVDNNVAIVLFGDPTHNVDASYNEGTSENNGIFALNEDLTQTCEDLDARIVSYCDAEDVYCDQGDNQDVHGEYFEIYGDEVVAFVVAQFANVESGGSPNATATVSPSTVIPSASATQSSGGGGEATETGDAGDAASWLEPGRGLMYTTALVAAMVMMHLV